MVNGTGLYPQAGVEAGEVPAVGPAGARLLTGTVRATGLDTALSRALESWRRPLAVHDPGKIIVDLALCAALGGRALSDLAVLRGQGELFGPVASDPTHGLPVDEDPGRGRRRGRGRRGGGPGGGAAAGVVPGRRALAGGRDQRGESVGDRRGRHPGGGALGQGGGGADVQGGLRLPPPDRLVRPRPRRGRAVRGDHAAAGQRGGEHRRRFDLVGGANKSVNRIRQVVEQTIAHIKAWRILHTEKVIQGRF